MSEFYNQYRALESRLNKIPNIASERLIFNYFFGYSQSLLISVYYSKDLTEMFALNCRDNEPAFRNQEIFVSCLEKYVKEYNLRARIKVEESYDLGQLSFLHLLLE